MEVPPSPAWWMSSHHSGGVAAVDQLDPASAEQFLAECTNLGEEMRRRRGTTLRRWLSAFRSRAAPPRRSMAVHRQLSLSAWTPDLAAAAPEAQPSIDWPD